MSNCFPSLISYDLDPTHDRNLLEIKNFDPVGSVLSKFKYTHAATGRIDTWTQFHSALTNPRQYGFGNVADRAHGLKIDREHG
jgi:hypothetical protein